ncbi:MAG: NAD-glutamate dehydrogenase domain-containing protein, partial [Acidimicrobiia bacterium]
ASALSTHPDIARALVRRFEHRLDPTTAMTDAAAREERDAIVASLGAVTSLNDDRILRALLSLIDAVVRTNYFQRDGGGQPRATLAVKLDPSRVPDLPLPRPAHEIWVYSPRTEGVHLRGGDVARGGIRWSDRRADFRTEVLGLMKAQLVKNAVIVPTGAKGGFVVKQAPADPDGLRAEVEACYRIFIGALLDLTDNLVGGQVVHPLDTRIGDGHDPYLVVAADKGTASFSDLANAIALERGFWLGDAFASGGSAGYDHKEMAITARGAWESVRSHARTLGRNADAETLTVVGIGDMSGDVFGNGLLRSSHLRLVAAFDHRHVFLDPSPDPAASFAERQRLFDLPRSSWADYDSALISPGGGVWPRSAKSVPLSAQVRAVLGIDAATTELTPDELISAVLRAPVDLLWNGGIGTYVKATEERHGDVGDRANDAVRVNGRELRCAMVAEGGNLGFTQRGRVEYALAGGANGNGGLINTDAIDNSAGVDCSDHEVNIKIALGAAVADGEISEAERNMLLASMTDDVAELVLADNIAQNRALANARQQSAPMIDVHARYVRSLVTEGLLDRELEFLPTDRQMGERHAAGRGLVGPELAVLMAYTKIADIADVLRSTLPDDPFLERELFAYFPPQMRDRFTSGIRSHRLRREIIATAIVNRMVNRAGLSSDFRLSEQTGATVAEVVAAHIVAADLFELERHWSSIEALDGTVDAAVQVELFLRLRRLIERAVLWLLTHRRSPRPLSEAISELAPGVRLVVGMLSDIVAGEDRDDLLRAGQQFRDAGLPAELADIAAAWPLAHVTLDVVDVAVTRRRAVHDVASVHELVGDILNLDWLRRRLDALPRNDRWQTQCRHALRLQLADEHRALTAMVFAEAPSTALPDDLVSGWQGRHRRSIDRAIAVLGEVRALATTDLSTLTVCVAALADIRRSE